MKRKMNLILILLLAILFSGCARTDERDVFRFEAHQLELKIGEQLELKLVLGDISPKEEIIYSSSNQDVVNLEGNVAKALKVGVSKVTAQVKRLPTTKATVEITVVDEKLSGLKINGDSQVKVNGSLKLTISTNPTSISKDVEWSSSDESIATVSSGTITPLKEGVVTITATTKDGGKTASKTLTVVKEDYTPYEVSIEGTYEIDPGYGYVLHLDDEKSTTIHCDYNKTEGRHEFYYNVKVGESSSFIKFQAKDAKYKSKLAKGYKTWDVRDSKYVFTAKATGNNSSVAYAYMYLHTDGSVVVNTPSGTKRVVESEGLSWKEENNTIVVSKGNETYIADKTVSTEHPGYKISYGSYVFLNSQSESVKWKNLTVEDFEGKANASFKGRYEITGPGGGSGEITMSLYNGGVAKLYKNTWNLDSTGTWTKNGDEYVITFGEGDNAKTYTSVTEDGNQFISYVVSAKTPWGSDASTEVKLEIVK